MWRWRLPACGISGIRPVAKSNFRNGGDSLPGIEANRQVCPTISEITLANALDDGVRAENGKPGVISMPRFAFARPVQVTKRALQIMNLALVINLLPLGQFECFKHFLHLIERLFELFNDPIDLLDGIRNRGSACFYDGFLASLRLLDGCLRR